MSGEALITVSDDSALLLRTKIDDKNIRKIALGQAAIVTVGNNVMKGLRQSDRRTRHRVDRSRARRKNSLQRGDAAQATLELEDIPNMLTVPLTAVSKNENGETYAVVRRQGRWARRLRRVTLGRASNGSVQVLKGLGDGDSVGTLSTDITDAGVDGTRQRRAAIAHFHRFQFPFQKPVQSRPFFNEQTIKLLAHHFAPPHHAAQANRFPSTVIHDDAENGADRDVVGEL